MELRVAEPEDVDAIVETIALAFRRDPVWGPALAVANGSEAHLPPFWRLYVEGALRHRTVFLTPNAATASVWIPPGESELSDKQQAVMTDLVTAALELDRASAMFELWDRFEANHRHDEPHAYLSLLATRPAFAGRGYGQAHLAANLDHWDAVGVPTYLESSNPANNHRYHRQGYAKVGEFRTVLDHAVVTTMWRPVRG